MSAIRKYDQVNIVTAAHGGDTYIIASGMLIDIIPVENEGRWLRVGRVLVDHGPDATMAVPFGMLRPRRAVQAGRGARGRA